jgi:hypothetical protein
MNALINAMPQDAPMLLTGGFLEDFERTTQTTFNTLAADAGASVAISTTLENGCAVLTTGGTDNNEANIYSNKIGSLTSGKPHLLVVRLQYTEANTDDANILVMISDAAGTANMLIDDGGGPIASFSGACFYKIDGGTRWQFRSQSGVANSQVTTDLEKTVGGSSYQTLAIMINPISTSEFIATPWIDTLGGNNLIQPFKNGYVAGRDTAVQNRVAWSGSVGLRAIIGVKAGGANSEVLNVDYAIFRKKR